MHPINKIKEFVVRQSSVVLGVVGFILGIIIAFEYSAQIPRIINPAQPSVALDQMEQNLSNEQASLKEQQEAVDSEITSLQNNLKDKQTGMSFLVGEVDTLKTQAGFTPLSGEGVEIVLDDSDKNDENANAIAHASDLRDLVDYMWSRGAQAISIEAAGGVEERVILPSSIDCIVNTVLINTTKSSPPFKMKVIGNRDALTAAINDRSALKSIYDRVDKSGLRFYITDNLNITVTKFTGSLSLDHAKIQ